MKQKEKNHVMNLHVKREKNQQKYIVDTILWKERILTLKSTKTSLVGFVTKRRLFLKENLNLKKGPKPYFQHRVEK